MDIKETVALVTGANRGLGRHFTQQLLDKVDPAIVVRAALDGIEQDRLDVVVDEWSATVKASLAEDPSRFYVLDQR